MLDVLLPFYGDPALMRLAVESVLHQSVAPDRLIVVDDCYPDPAAEAWLRGLDHPHVTYVRNDDNLGANANYRKALELSRAEYVVFMGADDLMLPDFVERTLHLVTRFDRPDVVQGGVGVIDGLGSRHQPLVDRVKEWFRPRTDGPHEISGEAAVVSLLRGNWTYFPSLVWRRAAIAGIGFRQGFDVVQDLALLVDLLTVGGRMVVDDRQTFEYRRHDGSDSSVRAGTGTRFDEEARYFDLIGRELREHGWGEASRAARLHVTSRLHAGSKVPAAARSMDWAGVARAVGHALG